MGHKETLIHWINSLLFESLMSLDRKRWKSRDAEINVRKFKTLYIGDEAEKLAKSLMKNKILRPIVLEFYKTVKKAYINAREYLQQK